jgi:hypothetical protein
MKNYLIFTILIVVFLCSSCTEEDPITPSTEVAFELLFKPEADAHPLEKKLFDTYGVWVRMDFKDSKEVYNSYLGQDIVNARFPAQKVDESNRISAYQYMDTLLSNVSIDFCRQLMPNEIFFIKTYGHPAWGFQFYVVARNRLAFVWPNTTYGAQPIDDPATHYYRDSTLTRTVWGHLTKMIGDRITEEIPEFVKIGKPYDGGAAFTKIRDQYFVDYDREKRDAAWQKLADQSGYLDAYSSFSYKEEFAGWLKLLTTESYANIYNGYLKDNAMRRAKYTLFVDYFKKVYKWDIQATGNKYRQQTDLYR